MASLDKRSFHHYSSVSSVFSVFQPHRSEFFTTENTEVTEIELLLWRLQEETMASTIRRKASAQRANAIVFIAQPIWEVPWHLLTNAFYSSVSSVSSVF